MFVGKARDRIHNTSFSSYLKYISSLSLSVSLYLTKSSANNKHSSLLWILVNYSRKSFIKLATDWVKFLLFSTFYWINLHLNKQFSHMVCCSREYWRGKYHCTVGLLFDQFGLACFANKNKQIQFSYSWFQTSQTGGQRYSDTVPFSVPWLQLF